MKYRPARKAKPMSQWFQMFEVIQGGSERKCKQCTRGGGFFKFLLGSYVSSIYCCQRVFSSIGIFKGCYYGSPMFCLLDYNYWWWGGSGREGRELLRDSREQWRCVLMNSVVLGCPYWLIK